MKIEKKHIIIAIVVAVAAYLVWKKRKGQTEAGNTSSAVYADSVDSIIAASGMTSSDAAKVRSFVQGIEASAVKKEQMEQKAISRGFTYAQMLVLDGLWTIYCKMDNGTSVFKDEYADNATVKSYYWRVAKAIKSL